MAHNSSVKIAATAGKRDEHVKVKKNSGTAHTLTRRGPISIDGNRWGVHAPKKNNVTQRKSREL